jgi:glycosyltransferase involved in cell wall biosynthesis
MCDLRQGPAVDVSIVVCCHNSRERIQPTLEQLALQRVPSDVFWEVILVDNASTDDTAEFALGVWARCGAPAPFRIHHEARLGLTYARLSGFGLARGEIVSFVDDDNRVGLNWCQRVSADFASDASIGIVGACGQPVFENDERPPWFDRYHSGYAVGPQRQDCGYFYGAGLSLRRQALADLLTSGFNPILTGRMGCQLTAGDDAELCLALALAGWKLLYDPELVFEHFLPEQRLSELYLRKMYYGFGYSSALQDIYIRFRPAAPLRRRLSANLTLRCVVALGKVLLFSIRGRIPERSPHHKLSVQVGKCYVLGRLRGLIETRKRSSILQSEITRWLAVHRAAEMSRSAPTARP